MVHLTLTQLNLFTLHFLEAIISYAFFKRLIFLFTHITSTILKVIKHYRTNIKWEKRYLILIITLYCYYNNSHIICCKNAFWNIMALKMSEEFRDQKCLQKTIFDQKSLEFKQGYWPIRFWGQIYCGTLTFLIERNWMKNLFGTMKNSSPKDFPIK